MRRAANTKLTKNFQPIVLKAETQFFAAASEESSGFVPHHSFAGPLKSTIRQQAPHQRVSPAPQKNGCI